MAAYACCHEGCAHRICFDDVVERELRRTGAWWFCPAGHRQHFITEPTPEQKRIAELERQVERERESYEIAWRYYEEERVAATDARRDARTCPLCGTVFRTRRYLPDHLADAHGAAMAAPLILQGVR